MKRYAVNIGSYTTIYISAKSKKAAIEKAKQDPLYELAVSYNDGEVTAERVLYKER